MIRFEKYCYSGTENFQNTSRSGESETIRCPTLTFFSQRVFRRPFVELHLGGFQVEPKDLIDLRGQFPGGCDDGGPHHELQAAGAAAHALRQGAAHDLESGDQEGQGLP